MTSRARRAREAIEERVELGVVFGIAFREELAGAADDRNARLEWAIFACELAEERATRGGTLFVDRARAIDERAARLLEPFAARNHAKAFAVRLDLFDRERNEVEERAVTTQAA
jgi:hypothetical protein